MFPFRSTRFKIRGGVCDRQRGSYWAGSIFVLSPSWIQDLIQAYGLWVLFTVIMLESMGIPMPGETALITAALYAGSTHQIGIAAGVLVAAAAAAAMIGDNIGYLIGRSIGIRLVMRYGRYLRLNEPRLKVGQYLFLRHGGKIVFFGRFVAFLRTFVALLAGVNRMSWPHFLIMNALGGICWASLFGGGAYLFGEQMKRVAGPGSLLLLLVAAIGLAAAGIFFFDGMRRSWNSARTQPFRGLGCNEASDCCDSSSSMIRDQRRCFRYRLWQTIAWPIHWLTISKSNKIMLIFRMTLRATPQRCDHGEQTISSS
jgi:membrane protein DedA with SNARE-associated domain